MNPENHYITRVEEEEVVDEIRRRLADDVASWREIVEMCSGAGVSVNRLRKILLCLINSGEVVELKCRLFTSKEFLERAPKELLAERIREAVSRSGLRKCGKPLGIPMKCVSIIISKAGEVAVIDERR